VVAVRRSASGQLVEVALPNDPDTRLTLRFWCNATRVIGRVESVWRATVFELRFDGERVEYTYAGAPRLTLEGPMLDPDDDEFHDPANRVVELAYCLQNLAVLRRITEGIREERRLSSAPPPLPRSSIIAPRITIGGREHCEALTG